MSLMRTVYFEDTCVKGLMIKVLILYVAQFIGFHVETAVI